MKNVKLDRTDGIILRELQDNGRITNVELAEKAGISPPPCLRRVRTLEKEGYIKGYHAEISPEKLGFGMVSFIHVSLTNHAESDLAAFLSLIERWPEVRCCHMLMGDTDFVLRVVTKDLSTFQSFLTDRLLTASNVAHLKTYPVVRLALYRPGVPIPDDFCEEET